jgi:hypothetical protein
VVVRCKRVFWEKREEKNEAVYTDISPRRHSLRTPSYPHPEPDIDPTGVLSLTLSTDHCWCAGVFGISRLLVFLIFRFLAGLGRGGSSGDDLITADELRSDECGGGVSIADRK